MTSTLTDRYIAATLWRVPSKQRREIELELRAAIADSVDARVEHGESPDAAEYAALAELGDPARLAVRYSDQSRALIGPEVYPSYIRTLSTFCWMVLPITASALVIVSLVQGKDVWYAIFHPFGVTLTVFMYLAVFVTVLFVIVDRVEGNADAARATGAWTPTQLPAVEESQPTKVNSAAEVISVIIFAVIGVVALFAQRTLSPVTDAAGAPVPLLAPTLWDFWIPCLLALLALTVVLDIVKVRLGRWTAATAAIGSVLAVVTGGVWAWLFWHERMVNPAFLSALGADAAVNDWIRWIAVVSIVGATFGRLIELWRPSEGDVRIRIALPH